MSRGLTTGITTAVKSPLVRPALFVSCQFANETIYVWSGIGSITILGQTWLGVGTLGNISPIAEGTSVEAKGITLTLSGIDPQWLGDSLNYFTTTGVAYVYVGFFDATGAIIDAPVVLFKGLMDQPVINIAAVDVDGNKVADKITISISVENKLSDLNRARGGRLTHQDQKARYPNDNGLKFVALIQDKFVDWHA